jgi:hypothetical protein
MRPKKAEMTIVSAEFTTTPPTREVNRSRMRWEMAIFFSLGSSPFGLYSGYKRLARTAFRRLMHTWADREMNRYP